MTAAALIRERLRNDLKRAMQQRRAEDVRLIRTLMAAIDNAEAVAQPPGAKPADSVGFASGAAEAARRMLDEADIAAIFAAEIAARRAAARQMRNGGADAEAEGLEREADRASIYLPLSI